MRALPPTVTPCSGSNPIRAREVTLFPQPDSPTRPVTRPSSREKETPSTARTSPASRPRSEEHTSELQSRFDLVCRLLLEKKKLDTSNIGMEELNNDHDMTANA